MNVLFVIPPSRNKKKFMRLIDCSHETKGDYLWQPNDYIIISSLLRKNDNAFFIDGTADELLPEQFSNHLNTHLNKNIDVIFFSTGSATYFDDIIFFKEIREKFIDITICILGDVFLEKNFRSHILSLGADCIIFQPFNLDFNEIINLRKNKDQNVKTNSVITDPNYHPFLNINKKIVKVSMGIPRHELFKKNYSWPFLTNQNFTTLTTMWGCTYSCSYCPTGKIHPFTRSNEEIIEELKYIKELGFEEIQFFDKVFGIPKKDKLELLETIIQQKLTFPFSCYFHPSMYDPKLLNLMKEAGCHTIIIGIDSVDLKSLAQYQRNVNEQTLKNLIDHCEELKIDICADFIIGLPHEKISDIKNTIKFSKKISIDFASFNIAAAMPGSSLRENLLKKNVMKNFELEDSLNAKFTSNNISVDELIKLRKYANLSFYLRPSLIIRRILRLKSFGHFIIQVKQMFGLLKQNLF
jgi:anaerobic magnesium-protoporphyrin IX monomethyl ester cyclase